MYCEFFKCTVNLNFKQKWKKYRFLAKYVNFQRFLKILLLMILDAINRISFGNCRRSKGFQVNYGKPDFVNILSKFKFAVHFTLKFSSEHINSIIPFIVFIYWFSHFVNFENVNGYLAIYYMGLYRYRLSHQACCLCVVQVCRSMNVCLTENEA